MALRHRKLRPWWRVFPDAVPWTGEQILELVWVFYDIGGNVDSGLFAVFPGYTVSTSQHMRRGREREKERNARSDPNLVYEISVRVGFR